MKQAYLLLFLLLSISVSIFAQPANDDCLDAITIANPESWCDTASNVGAGNDTFDNLYMGIVCPGITPMNDVWYTFTTSDTVTEYIITLNAIDFNGDDSIQNPVIVVYNYDPGEGAPCETQMSGVATSTLPFICESADIGFYSLSVDLTNDVLSPNETYYFMIASYSASASAFPGGFEVCMNSYIPFNATCNNVSLETIGDTVVCNDAYSGTMSANLSLPNPLDVRYQWIPNLYLDDDNLANPTITNLIQNTVYTVEAVVLSGINLIVNGDFSDGDQDFTTEYVYGTGGTYGLLSVGGQYAVDDNPGDTHVNFCNGSDHTGDAAGNMMVVNGAWTANTEVWCQTVTVEPNTWYDFSTWATSVVSSNPSVLQFSINDNLLGNTFSLNSTTCTWLEFYEQWYSDTATTASICIVNQSTAAGGNDFALDDISLQPICFFEDSVSVSLIGNTYDIIENNSICEGEDISLGTVNDSNTSYLWSPSLSLDDGTVGNPIASPSTTTNYTLIASNSSCSDTLTTTITVDIIPTVSLTTDANSNTICYGDELNFSVTTNAPIGADYNWYPSAVFLGEDNLNPSITPTSNGNYSIEIDNNGCTASDTVSIDLLFPPIYSINASNTICEGDSVQIGNIHDTNTNYQWSSSNDLSNNTIGNPYAMPNSTTIYTLIAQNGICIDTVTAMVTVNPSPTIHIESDAVNDSICPGDILNILVNSGATATYSWTPMDAFTNPNLANQSTVPNQNTTYYLSVEDNGCSNNDSISVYLADSLVYGLIPMDERNICFGEAITLGTINSTSTNYNWSSSDGSLMNANTGLATASPNSTSDYTLIASNGFCEETVDLTINVTNYIFDVDDISICEDVYIELDANTLGLPNGIMTWYNENGVILSIENQVTINNPASGYYFLDFEENGCIFTDSFYVNVINDFDISISADPSTTIPNGDDVTLIANPPNSINNPSFEWSTNETTQSITVTPIENSHYNVTVTSEEGCVSEGFIEITLRPSEDAKIPNVFTPNGITNRFFFPVYVDGINAAIIEFKVFDRWGELVFDNTNELGWDGTFEGQEMPQDVYAYFVKVQYFDNRIETLKGSITLLR